ncbi:hypothetical protein [Oenococcus oeni]|uniref:hypothetical protein n=1 Tax=Oenococcus oeni TaxID=1247 RepID=UPI000AA94BA0|nr:hypothetical protein [Oenococcus oeni]
MADDSAVTPVAPVTPAIMQDYFKVDADESVLQDLITTSEIETQNAINSDIPLTVYREYVRYTVSGISLLIAFCVSISEVVIKSCKTDSSASTFK